MARHAQRAAAWWRHLLHVDVVADLPFPLVGQTLVAVGQAGAACALALVDARNVGAADQQIDAGGAALQRRGGAVHGRCARTHHAHALALERAVVHLVGRMRPYVARQLVGHRRHPCTAQTIATGGEYHMAREYGARAVRRLHVELHHTVGTARAHGQHAVFVVHLQVQHLAIPAQIVHPLQARNLVERVPFLDAELRFEPCAEGERRLAERGAGERLGRAQGFHARGRGPGAFKACGRAVEDGRIHAQKTQRGRCGHAAHAAADDSDRQHFLAVHFGGRQPVLGGQIEPRQILAHAGFKRFQTLWRRRCFCGCGGH